MKISVLIENSANENFPDLETEHGLSLLIDVNDHKILFDSGQSHRFINNAKKLNQDLSQVSLAILSHGHYDHGNGFTHLLRSQTNLKIHMAQNAHDKRYARRWKLLRKNIGISKTLLQNFPKHLVYHTHLAEITKDVYVLPQISKKFKTPKGNATLYVEKDSQLVPDDFSHELILVIKTPSGLVIFSGCAHSGIQNIVSSVKLSFPKENILAIIGGFHLIESPILGLLLDDENSLKEIAHDLMKLKGLRKVYTGHCTSAKAFLNLKEIMKGKLEALYTGLTIDL